MEYKYLAHVTGRSHYYNKVCETLASFDCTKITLQVEHVMEIMYKASVPNGLFPTKWDLESGAPRNCELDSS